MEQSWKGRFMEMYGARLWTSVREQSSDQDLDVFLEDYLRSNAIHVEWEAGRAGPRRGATGRLVQGSRRQEMR